MIVSCWQRLSAGQAPALLFSNVVSRRRRVSDLFSDDANDTGTDGNNYAGNDLRNFANCGCISSPVIREIA